jgi:6-phosphogluconolactonase/Glucosamine-6-phosphate isomerase/deaminase
MEGISTMPLTKEFTKDLLKVKCFDTREAMGRAAARDVADRMIALAAEKEEINMIFAAAPSQNELLSALCAIKEIPWGKVNAFHMDEYIGLDRSSPQRFGNFLKDHIFSRVPFKSVFYIRAYDNGEAGITAECERYGELLGKHPVDIVCLGIGENGHIAFNDPAVADFHDKRAIKPVALDDVCRNQQVHDGCFASLGQVPTYALTLTVPTLLSGSYLFCVVPAAAKAAAAATMVNGEIGEYCPCTALRAHGHSVLYLDGDSGRNL